MINVLFSLSGLVGIIAVMGFDVASNIEFGASNFKSISSEMRCAKNIVVSDNTENINLVLSLSNQIIPIFDNSLARNIPTENAISRGQNKIFGLYRSVRKVKGLSRCQRLSIWQIEADIKGWGLPMIFNDDPKGILVVFYNFSAPLIFNTDIRPQFTIGGVLSDSYRFLSSFYRHSIEPQRTQQPAEAKQTYPKLPSSPKHYFSSRPSHTALFAVVCVLVLLGALTVGLIDKWAGGNMRGGRRLLYLSSGLSCLALGLWLSWWSAAFL